ncbi:MAG: endopeptidase La [Bacteroidales bacterium]|nr:endopeptidase La [Bacteroidales bacterium]
MDRNENMFGAMFSPGATEVNIIPVMSGEGPLKINEADLPDTLPVLALRNAVIFPGTVYPITIGREKSMQLVSEAQESGMFIGAVPQVNLAEENPRTEADFFDNGTVCKVLKTFEMPDGTVTALLQGFKRLRLDRIVGTEPYIRARVHYLDDIEPDMEDPKNKIIADLLKESASNYIKAASFAPKEVVSALRGIEDFGFLVNFIATTVEIENYQDKVTLLKYDDVKERAMALLSLLSSQMELLRIKQEINSKVKTEIDQQQREYYLNNQLRTIQEELGMDEDDDINQLRAAAEKKEWPASVGEIFEKELAKLGRFNPSAPEYSIQYAYLQFMLDLPWYHMSEDNLDLAHAQKVLDEDHFGLDSVKDRIIEYLAVLKLKGNMKSPILCLYGPPGVGKTSLGKSIARALGRQYVRISLGGMHDEAEIRGHRKTYVGALPGRILSGISRAGTSNPVVVLDEIDKVGADFKGDPSSALLEALDPEQNTAFHDNYLDVDYDLSNVLFITTANSTATIQPALLDRMEVINVTGYLAEEKMEIAKKFLVPKQLKEHGIDAAISIHKPALRTIIDEYTHESGVRGLEKQIAKIARVTAKKIALGEPYPTVIKKEHLREYLGLPTAFHDMQKGNEAPGVVTGLAWTSLGGEILFVESQASEGKGVQTMTGNLGDVMKESATIGYQYIKAHPQLAGLTAEEFAKKDIHVHVPEGATPKDGPSAGITMVSSMVSALRGKAVRSGIAMTGEMTLRGRVLPVGGIKEKILAAKRAGVHTIVISEENRKDVEDIKEIYRKGLTFVYVKTIDDVIGYIFE